MGWEDEITRIGLDILSLDNHITLTLLFPALPYLAEFDIQSHQWMGAVHAHFGGKSCHEQAIFID